MQALKDPSLLTHSTFGNQDALPKLPLPELKDTCKRYLETIQPLETETQFATTSKHVEEFVASKEGMALQERLKEYAATRTNYIEEFWTDAYLIPDESVVLNLNPFFVLEDDPTPSRNNQLARAASLVFSSMKFIQALRTQKLEPDVWRNVPLCMHQFNYLFGASREPHGIRDTINVDKDSKHIVVLCKNQFYWFDLIWPDGTPAINEKQLVENFRSIYEDAQQIAASDAAMSAVGVLTTEHRRNWARLRDALKKDNAGNLDMVDRALFLVCLDDTSPPSAADFAATALHGTYSIVDGIQTGTCTNRWYDKLQIIVCENGVAGVNFEHSTVDGHTVLRFVSDIFTDTIIRFAQTIRGGTVSLFEGGYRSPHQSKARNRPSTSPRKLEWQLSEQVILGIRYAESKLSDLILQNEVRVLEFTSYGKLFIIQHDISPDAFVQIAFAASYYSLYGSNVNIYEPVLTKKFSHGRTEAARSMTKEAAAFVRVFCSNDKTPLEKLQALKEAVAAQVKMVVRCASGGGIDRHLYALKCLWHRENPNAEYTDIPNIFKDAGWSLLNDTIMSTSNCGNPSLRLFGFGPVVQSGFGIGYIIKDEGIQFCASSKHRQTTRFLDTLETYLMEVQEMLMKAREMTFPNLSKQTMGMPRSKRARTLSFRRGMKGGYGFFDAGTDDEEQAVNDERIGRSL